jgi:serine/threonine protein kinase
VRKREVEKMEEKEGGEVKVDEDGCDIRREIAILKKISHPNINAMVEVLDDVKEDNLYMIFELCEYGPLMKIKLNNPITPYSEDYSRKLFRDVILGLEYLHFNRIVHRDLKPENLLLNAKGVAQIADFGISDIVCEEDFSVENKISSYLFNPPEVFISKNKKINGESFDVWSLGVTLYCFLHGRCPFEDTDILQLSQKIMEDEVVLEDSLSSLAKDVLMKMMIKDPANRILLAELKMHEWVSCEGLYPMMSRDENLNVYSKNTEVEMVTDEEVENALKPAVTLFTKVINIFKRTATKRMSTPTFISPTRSAKSSSPNEGGGSNDTNYNYRRSPVTPNYFNYSN